MTWPITVVRFSVLSLCTCIFAIVISHDSCVASGSIVPTGSCVIIIASFLPSIFIFLIILEWPIRFYIIIDLIIEAGSFKSRGINWISLCYKLRIEWRQIIIIWVILLRWVFAYSLNFVYVRFIILIFLCLFLLV